MNDVETLVERIMRLNIGPILVWSNRPGWYLGKVQTWRGEEICCASDHHPTIAGLLEELALKAERYGARER